MAKKKPSPSLSPKAPVVTIMGHVDHGKTTLLDKIRNSSITAKEHGGITQHIDAYQVTHSGKKITFIDTPGHAAFSKMRARGASVTDLAILVVAADDGVKPQTKESIKHIKTANLPVIVAINKIDVKGASPDMVKSQLVKDDIQVEGFGGSVPVVEISALKGTGIDNLLETILLLSEMESFTTNDKAPLQAVVIESHLQKNRGPTATLLVRQGTLNTGDKIISSDSKVSGTTKKLTSDTGTIITKALPATPVEILGLKSVPEVGTVFTLPETLSEVKKSLQKAKTSKLKTKAKLKPKKIVKKEDSTSKTSKKDDKEKPAKKDSSKEEDQEELEEEEPEEKITINIILKSDSVGTLEAIRQNLGEEVEVIKGSVGQVTESDVMLARSTNSVIIAFNVKTDKSAEKLAQLESVTIKFYSVIYKLLEDFESQVLKLLEPTIDEQELGTAKVKAIFTIKEKTVAGCSVDSGAIPINSKIHLKRKDKIVADATIISLKHGKEEITTAKAGTQCGIILKPNLDIQIGDRILSYKKIDSSDKN